MEAWEHDTHHHQPVDSKFVEGLSKTEVVEAEEDGPEEANADHREEPVLAVHVGGGGAHDAEEREDLNIAVQWIGWLYSFPIEGDKSPITTAIFKLFMLVFEREKDHVIKVFDIASFPFPAFMACNKQSFLH